MRSTLILPAIIAVAFSFACSKSESDVRPAESVQPTSETSQPMTETVATPATDTGMETSSEPTSEEVTPAAEPTATTPRAATAPEPVAKPVRPAPTAPEATAPKSAETTPAPAPPATSTTAAPSAEVPQASPPATETTPPAAPAKPAVRASSGKAPKSHTVDREGIMHAPGTEDVGKKCAACHGQDLKGGKMAKISCFECHEKNWQ